MPLEVKTLDSVKQPVSKQQCETSMIMCTLARTSSISEKI